MLSSDDRLPPGLDYDLVVAFFWRFSVFECALKRAGFLENSTDGAEARAGWDQFANSIRGKFSSVQDLAFEQAVAHLRNKPPRKQVVSKGGLAWKESEPQDGVADEAFVLRMVRRVRNNLFHGGKYPYAPQNDVARDTELLRSALIILKHCYSLAPDVQRHEAWQG